MILFFCSVCVINPPWRDISIGLVIKTWKNTSHHLSSFNATWKSVLANLYLWLMFCYLPLPLELLLATQKYKWASWISIPRQIEINVSEKPAEPEEICNCFNCYWQQLLMALFLYVQELSLTIHTYTQSPRKIFVKVKKKIVYSNFCFFFIKRKNGQTFL